MPNPNPTLKLVRTTVLIKPGLIKWIKSVSDSSLSQGDHFKIITKFEPLEYLLM